MPTSQSSAAIIRIIVAEDNDDLRAVMPPLLNEHPDMHCAAVTPFLDEVAVLIEQHDAHVAILDIELRGGSALRQLPQFCSQFPATRFIIHSGHSNPELIRLAKTSGADAYVLKSGDFDELVNVIRAITAVPPAP
jgi:DNA-binding NarL/FixJ family response regulator